MTTFLFFSVSHEAGLLLTDISDHLPVFCVSHEAGLLLTDISDHLPVFCVSHEAGLLHEKHLIYFFIYYQLMLLFE